MNQTTVERENVRQIKQGLTPPGTQRFCDLWKCSSIKLENKLNRCLNWLWQWQKHIVGDPKECWKMTLASSESCIWWFSDWKVICTPPTHTAFNWHIDLQTPKRPNLSMFWRATIQLAVCSMKDEPTIINNEERACHGLKACRFPADFLQIACRQSLYPGIPDTSRHIIE